MQKLRQFCQAVREGYIVFNLFGVVVLITVQRVMRKYVRLVLQVVLLQVGSKGL